MKKWENLVPPDDPNSWFDVDGVWPTKDGAYETCDFLSGSGAEYTATSAGTPVYAWTGQTLSSTREFVIGSQIWEYAAGAFTDRTGGVAVGSIPMLAAYGDVIIGTMGTGNPTVKSTGGNFSALAGAPNASIICTQSNAVQTLGLLPILATTRTGQRAKLLLERSTKRLEQSPPQSPLVTM
jgi:hypothetical protein